MIKIQSPKFHEVKAIDLFTRPNDILTDILKREVNIFEVEKVLYSFTKTLSGTPEERIQQILEHGTPRYYCELYPEGDTSYTQHYPVGAFYASENYYYLDIFHNSSERHGDILLIYEKNMLQQKRFAEIYTVREGYNYSEALQAIIYPNYGTTVREALNSRIEIREFINKHR